MKIMRGKNQQKNKCGYCGVNEKVFNLDGVDFSMPICEKCYDDYKTNIVDQLNIKTYAQKFYNLYEKK